jgi:tetratricopeptide (TPR) repeat protein
MNHEAEARPSPPAVSTQGCASGQGKVYQAVRDQLITEHHHHYPASGPDASRAAGPAAAPDSVRTPLTGRPPLRLLDRREIVSALIASCEAGGAMHVLHGMGGSGKTAIAHTVFQLAVQRGLVGLWVNAADRMTLRAGMLAVAADRGAGPGELAAAYGGQRAAADLVWHYLDRSPEYWLLVLDNADDPAILEEGGWLRSSPVGTVVVTSRNAASRLWRNTTRSRIDVLPLQDAAELLCDLAPEAGSRTEAEAVARSLGCLPLALTLAGSYLAHQLVEVWTMSDYGENLREDPITLIDQGALSGDPSPEARHLVSRTWQITLDALADQGIPEATTLMRLLAQWGAEPLPLTVLSRRPFNEAPSRELSPPLSGSQLEGALRRLLEHSLLTLVEVPSSAIDQRPLRCVQAHSLLLETVAASVPEEQRAALVRTATHLLDAALPTAEAPAATRSYVELLAPHARALLRRATKETASAVALLTVRVARLTYEAGDYESALNLAQAAAETAERLHGEPAADSLAAQHLAGEALRRLGRLAEAEALLRRVLVAREQLLGPDHPDTSLTSAALATPLYLQGQHAESVAYLRRAIAGQRSVLGEDDPETLRSRALLLEILAFFGDLEEFRADGAATVADCERVLGPDHPITGVAYSNYAFGMVHAGTPDEAEVAARRAVDARIRVLGPDHPLVYSAKLVHSWALMLADQHAEAVTLMREALDGRERLLGQDHPLSVKARILLAERLAAAGSRDEAEQLLRENQVDCERVYGAADPDLARVRERLTS